MSKANKKPPAIDSFYRSVLKQDNESVLSFSDHKTPNATLKYLAKEYIPWLYSNLKEEDFIKFLTLFWELFKRNISNNNTLAKASVELRKSLPDKDSIRNIIGLTKEQKKDQEEKNKESRDKKNREIREFSKEQIDEIINELGAKDDQKSLCALILLCTGRRLIETITSDFQYENKDFLIFSYRAKTTNPEEAEEEFHIPVYPPGSSKFILDKIDKFRDTLPQETKSNVELTHDLDARMNLFLSKLFDEPVTCHLLRKIYVALTYPIYGEQESYNAYIERVLIHKNLETSLNYSTVKII